MEIGFSPGAWRDWRRLPPDVQVRLKGKLLQYAGEPLKHAAKLTDPSLGRYRFRIGDYRIVFDISGNVHQVQAVGHLKDIYR